eukprot:4029522-Amphidinium_carterae.1
MLGEGLCKRGCGLRVAPGRNAKGSRYDTCCRGCGLGFSHDALCQRDDDTPAGDSQSPAFSHDTSYGMLPTRSTTSSSLTRSSASGRICKMGCGRPVAPGTYARTGKEFATCCR